MYKKIEKIIAVLFIAGALSGSMKAMKKAGGLKSFASIQSVEKNGQKSSVLPVVLMAGAGGAYVFRDELKACLKYCLIRSAMGVAEVGKSVLKNADVIPYRSFIPGFSS